VLGTLCAAAGWGQSAGTWKAPFSTDPARAYICARATTPIAIDGKMDEAAWARAWVIEDFIVPPVRESDGRQSTATSQSHARLMWDDRYLYLGAELEDRDLYCVTPAGHDAGFNIDDLLELFVKPREDLPYYWEIHVVPSGGTRDSFYARRDAGGEKRWLPYDSGMQAKVSLVGTLDDWTDRDTKWVVEMRIPWAAFERMGGRPRAGDMWRMMVARYDYSVHLETGLELSAAAPLTAVNYHLYEDFPFMRFGE